MLLALAVSLLLPAGDPPVRLKISDDVFVRGERVRVKVKTTQNGYLLVLRANAQGRVRVLFPVEPGDDGAIRGGKETEVRGRGGREAFTVDDAEGSGKIIAAFSAQPFQFDGFTRAGHWDYAALAATDSVAGDAEASLLALVDRMSSGAYDYDLVTYTVTAHPRFRQSPWAWGDPGRWGGGWDGWSPRFGCLRCRRWL